MTGQTLLTNNARSSEGATANWLLSGVGSSLTTMASWYCSFAFINENKGVLDILSGTDSQEARATLTVMGVSSADAQTYFNIRITGDPAVTPRPTVTPTPSGGATSTPIPTPPAITPTPTGVLPTAFPHETTSPTPAPPVDRPVIVSIWHQLPSGGARAERSVVTTIRANTYEGEVLGTFTRDGSTVSWTETLGGNITISVPLEASILCFTTEYYLHGFVMQRVSFNSVIVGEEEKDLVYRVRLTNTTGRQPPEVITLPLPADTTTPSLVDSKDYEPEEATWFRDVSSRHYAYEAVMFMVQTGVFQGYGDGTIRPDVEVTRAQGLVMLYNFMSVNGYPPRQRELRAKIMDVEDNIYYERAVHWGVSNGILQGKLFDHNQIWFHPYDPLTHEEMLTLIYRTLFLVGKVKDIDLQPIGNVSLLGEHRTSDWSNRYVRAMLLLIPPAIGDSNQLYPWRENLTRGQVAYLLHATANWLND
jgi:hypothetical protein